MKVVSTKYDLETANNLDYLEVYDFIDELEAEDYKKIQELVLLPEGQLHKLRLQNRGFIGEENIEDLRALLKRFPSFILAKWELLLIESKKHGDTTSLFPKYFPEEMAFFSGDKEYDGILSIEEFHIISINAGKNFVDSENLEAFDHLSKWLFFKGFYYQFKNLIEYKNGKEDSAMPSFLEMNEFDLKLEWSNFMLGFPQFYEVKTIHDKRFYDLLYISANVLDDQVYREILNSEATHIENDTLWYLMQSILFYRNQSDLYNMDGLLVAINMIIHFKLKSLVELITIAILTLPDHLRDIFVGDFSNDLLELPIKELWLLGGEEVLSCLVELSDDEMETHGNLEWYVLDPFFRSLVSLTNHKNDQISKKYLEYFHVLDDTFSDHSENKQWLINAAQDINYDGLKEKISQAYKSGIMNKNIFGEFPVKPEQQVLPDGFSPEDYFANLNKEIGAFYESYDTVVASIEKSIKLASSQDQEEEDIDFSTDSYYYEDDDYINQPFKKENPKIGRNEPCPCGSGKKYKKCCLKK